MKKTRLFAWLLTVALLGAVGIGSANAATSDYMHYETTGWVDTITICDPNDSSKCITMMDRNLWATKAGTWCSATDTWACGYHYQRWNNYWFAPNFSWNDSFPNGETVTTNERVDTTWYWPWNFYSGNIFRKITSSPYAWSTTRNDNLRWWAEDSESNNRWYDETTNTAINATGRRWPCEEWYHVPSIWEWNTVLKYWAEENGIELGDDSGLKHNWELNWSWYKFQEDFKIPFAGYRGNVANVYEIGDYALLRSSSPGVTNEFAQSFILRPDEADANGGVWRVDAISLRCFKDSALGFPSAASQVVFYDSDQTTQIWSGEVESGTILADSGTVTAILSGYENSKTGYTFNGWIISWTDTAIDLSDPITTWLELVASWEIDTYNLSIELDGWILEAWETNPTSYNVESEDITLKNPVREWYTFAWWTWTDLATPEVAVTIAKWSTWDREYFANWTANEYSITFKDWSWTETDVVWTWNYWDTVTATYPSWTKEWYTGSWDTTIPATVPAENTVITMTWTANQYTITFDTDWWSAINPITWNYNEPITAPANPTKAGAVFDSWSPAFPDTMPLGWATLKAIWRNALNNGWTAWWGWVKKEKDDCPNGDYSDSYYDGTCGSKDSSSNDDNLSSWANAKDIDSTEWLESNELQTAYERAYENWITTMDTVEKADLNGNLTRIAMAKMLSKYAINVLWKTPDETKINQFNDVDEKLDSEYDNGVSLAYQLWIMWINMPNNNFRPFDLVSRAEFVTALSRMRYGTPDGEYAGTAEYYKNHMEILSDKWIVSLLDPEMLELRGYVMVMLMRSK